MRFVWKIVWKTPVLAAAIIVGALGAIQVGWGGAGLIVNAPLMGPTEGFVTVFFVLAVGAAMTIGPAFLVLRIAKPALFLMVPILLFSAVVPGAWNGFASEFDTTRGAVIAHQWANGYALEHMGARGRFRTCEDAQIQLTDDAKAVCARALNVGPGERIPGSEYKCGFLGMFGCFNTAPMVNKENKNKEELSIRESIVDKAVKIYTFLLPLSWITLAVTVLILLPLAAWPDTRAAGGTGLVFVSYMFGATIWFLGAAITFGSFGWSGLIIGIFVFGIGVVPLGISGAFLALSMNELGVYLFVMLFITLAARFAGAACIAASDRSRREEQRVAA
jgi:hypothetical protein